MGSQRFGHDWTHTHIHLNIGLNITDAEGKKTKLTTKMQCTQWKDLWFSVQLCFHWKMFCKKKKNVLHLGYQLANMDFPGSSVVKNLPAKQETWVWSLDQKDPLEKDMATHSSIPFWRILWTEEPGGIQSIGSHKSQAWLSNPTTIYLPILPPCSTFWGFC